MRERTGGKNRYKRWILGLLPVCMLCGLWSFLGRNSDDFGEKPSGYGEQIGSAMSRAVEGQYFQILRYLEEEKGKGAAVQKSGEPVEEQAPAAERLSRILGGKFLLYDYALSQPDSGEDREDAMMAELIRMQEGADEDVKDIDEAHLDYDDEALHIDGNLLEEMEKENSVHKAEEGENEESQEQGGVFTAAQYPAYTYDWSENWDYESLVSNFYAVDNSTVLKEEYVGLNQLLYEDLSVDKEVEGPQILIYHTHASESFLDSVPGDSSTTIVGAGERLAELLREEYGFQVMHHTGVYDQVRDEAYNETLPVLEQILEDNPTISVVIDLHRDAVAGDRKLVMDLQGRPTARFMFFNGLSYGRRSGKIDYLENPYIQDNLAFSFQVQVAANEYYPGLARKIYLKAYRYNLHLMPRSMLIELGAQNNTVEEIMNACEPLAHILSIVLG